MTSTNGGTDAGHIHATVGSRAWHPHRPPMFESEILENPVHFTNILKGDRLSGFLPFKGFVQR